MKTIYQLMQGNHTPPIPLAEFGAMCWFLTRPSASSILSKIGITLTPEFDIAHNTGTDDPPDFRLQEFGIEITMFPPDQAAISAILGKLSPDECHALPAYSLTRGNYNKIKDEMLDPASPTNSMVEPHFEALSDRAVALTADFNITLFDKDNAANEVLLLDGRDESFPDEFLIDTLCKASQSYPLKYLKFIIITFRDDCFQLYP